MFWVFLEGFEVLDAAISHEATKAQTIQAIYNVFFVSLLAMLAVSSGVILYGLLFDSEEVRYLLTTPASSERIVLHKFQEAIVLSCWGFILLGSPLLVAYGIQAEAPWYYFALLLPFLVSFVFLPAGCGAIVCLLLVAYLPRVRLHVLVSVCVLMLAAFGLLGWSVVTTNPNDIMTPLWFQDVMGRLRHSEQRLLPSYWLSSGLLEAAHPAAPGEGLASWRESLGFLSVLLANAMLVPVAVSWIGGKLLRPAFSQLMGIGRAGRTIKPTWMDTIVMRITAPLPMPVRLLLVKDLRLFRRDPLRWTQFLIFFGLLGLYFINVRRFHYGEPLDSWMTLIGFLNLGVVALIQSTFTTRFIFPMLSMEGRRFWILGTLPVNRDLILWGKLLFAAVVSVVPCSILILLSDFMLQIVQRTPWIALIHQLVCWSLCIGLSAIAVGLGARFPNLREPAPAKIAAGFGGTLNLVVSACFILVSVIIAAVPSYYWIECISTGTRLRKLFALGSTSAMMLGVGASILLAILVSSISLTNGIRAFRKMEP
jgi:ABC-2 type transport system permease protein